jgi:hypothetical protein
VIRWLRRLRNLELAFSVHEDRIKELEVRVDELEDAKEGKSCIGFVEDDDEDGPKVAM